MKRNWIIAGVSAFAAIGGLWWGYDFGESLGGGWFSVVTAANGALIAALLAGAAAERLLPGGGT